MYVTTLAFQSHANVMQQQPQLQRQAPASLLSQSLNSPSVSPLSESITFHKGCRAASKTYYVPNPSTISANSKVTWNNKDIEPHTATATVTATTIATDGSFDTGIINVGSSGSASVKTLGSIPYPCTIHPWMNGILQETS
jgi:plastocyanin